MTDESKQYCWSKDGSLYEGHFSTPEEAKAEAFTTTDYDEIHVGEIVPVDLESLIDHDGLIDTMICRLGDTVGEAGEDFLAFITEEDKKELLAMLRPVIAQWVEKHEPTTYFAVDNAQIVHRVEVTANG